MLLFTHAEGAHCFENIELKKPLLSAETFDFRKTNNSFLFLLFLLLLPLFFSSPGDTASGILSLTISACLPISYYIPAYMSLVTPPPADDFSLFNASKRKKRKRRKEKSCLTLSPPASTAYFMLCSSKSNFSNGIGRYECHGN